MSSCAYIFSVVTISNKDEASTVTIPCTVHETMFKQSFTHGLADLFQVHNLRLQVQVRVLCSGVRVQVLVTSTRVLVLATKTQVDRVPVAYYRAKISVFCDTKCQVRIFKKYDFKNP